MLPTDNPLWVEFVEYMKDSEIILDELHFDDWLPFWNCYLAGAGIQTVVPRKAPNWTVVTNLVSPEFIGKAWEFFEKRRDAEICYTRHLRNGNCPTLRPFHVDCDSKHLYARNK